MSRASRAVDGWMDGDGPYGRYYAEREAAGKRTAVWPWVLLAVVVPLLLIRTFVVHGADPVDPTATPEPAAPAVSEAADGEYRVGPGLVPGVYVTDGPAEGLACEWVRTGPDGAEVSRAAVHGPAAARLIDGETVVFSGGCAWSGS